jgi:hypothetical protein
MWANSAVFRAYLIDCILPSEQVRNTWANPRTRMLLALFSGAVTPNMTVPRAETLYGAGEWTTGRELTSEPMWPAGGVPWGMTQISAGDAIGLNPFNQELDPQPAPVTMAGINGDLMYDSVTGQGLAFHYWGGPVNITDGALTITWDTVWAIRLNTP